MTYSATSPYYETKITKTGLGMMVNRPIPKLQSDMTFEINTTYNHRPDLLAFDLYKDADLWWVFAQRNPNTLVDPLFDFKEGTSIRIPTLDTLRDALGF